MKGSTTTLESERTAEGLAKMLAGKTAQVQWTGKTDERQIVVIAENIDKRRLQDVTQCAQLAARKLADAEDRENLGGPPAPNIDRNRQRRRSRQPRTMVGGRDIEMVRA